MTNKILVSLSFLVMLMAPTVAICDNQQISRLTIACCLLLLVRKAHSFKLQVHHCLFIAWVVWCSIGVFFSEFPSYAFYGFYPYRGEGIITLLILTCFAFTYWQTFNTIKELGIILLVSALLIMFGHLFIVIYWRGDFGTVEHAKIWFEKFFISGVGIGSLMSTGFPILSSVFPWLFMISIIPIIDSTCRSALFAFACLTPILAWRYYKSLITVKGVAITWAFVCLLLFTSPIWFKLFHIEQKLAQIPNISRNLDANYGARPQWILQANSLSRSLPLTGFGLDTLSEYLRDPKGQEWRSYFISDRTHNIAYDIILMTGWLGYTILLLSFGYALAVAINYPSNQNFLCICSVIGWIIFGLFNPHGTLGNIVALIALFGIRKEEPCLSK